MNSKARKLRGATARLGKKRGPVRIFKVTASSFHYDEEKQQLCEYEMYFTIARRAGTVTDIKRIRTALDKKVRPHYRSWLLRHVDVRVETIHVNFEPEYRARRQVEEQYATVDRIVLRRVNKRWQGEKLQSGKMRFLTKRRRRHGGN